MSLLLIETVSVNPTTGREIQVQWGSENRTFENRKHSKSGHFSRPNFEWSTIRKPDVFVRFSNGIISLDRFRNSNYLKTRHPHQIQDSSTNWTYLWSDVIDAQKNVGLIKKPANQLLNWTLDQFKKI